MSRLPADALPESPKVFDRLQLDAAELGRLRVTRRERDEHVSRGDEGNNGAEAEPDDQDAAPEVFHRATQHSEAFDLRAWSKSLRTRSAIGK